MAEPPARRQRVLDEGDEDVVDDAVRECLNLRFGSSLHKPEFIHQIFQRGDETRLLGVSIDLCFEPRSWALTEIVSKDGEDHAFARDRLRSAECLRPLFEDKEILAIPKGRVVWTNEDGLELRYIDEQDETSKRLLKRGLAVATFYIERASQVDVNDPEWKLLLCVKQEADHEVLVGFTSIFAFNKPLSDSVIQRVCVMLVIPPFQRKRLGEHMMRAIYHEAKSQKDVIEVNVEDPCASFQKMRNRVDVQECANASELYFGWDLSKFASTKPPIFSPAKKLKAIQEKFKISVNQLQFCFETAWLKKIQELGQENEMNEAMASLQESIRNRIELKPNGLAIPDKERYPDEFDEVLTEEYNLALEAMEDAIRSLQRS